MRMPYFEPTLALGVGTVTAVVIVAAVGVMLVRSHRRRMRAIKALAAARAAEQAAAAERARDRQWLWDSLTPRQMQVATLVAQGKRSAQVAQELNVSVNTIEMHLDNIYDKLDVHTRIDLARLIRELVD
jgi:DNA-binding NarL/FixJ family response regulator